MFKRLKSWFEDDCIVALVTGALFALAVVLFASATFAEDRDAVCGPDNSLAAAEDMFGSPGDTMTVSPVADRDVLAALMRALAAPPEAVEAARGEAEYLLVARQAGMPRGAVAFGMFDDGECFLAGAANVPMAVLARFGEAFGIPEAAVGPSI